VSDTENCRRGPEEKIDREQRGSDCLGVQTYREAVSLCNVEAGPGQDGA
jgi:hypothetical protein